jgi:hypothetical protein
MRIPLTHDERDEFDSLLREIVGADKRPKVTADLADRLAHALDDAEQAHRTWPHRVREQALRAGLQTMVRRWIKDQAPTGFRTKKGNVIGLSGRAGVKRDGIHQQVMFEDMTPSEAAAYLTALDAQMRGIGVRRASVNRLIELAARHPEAPTIGAAVLAEGTTIDAVLGEQAA